MWTRPQSAVPPGTKTHSVSRPMNPCHPEGSSEGRLSFGGPVAEGNFFFSTFGLTDTNPDPSNLNLSPLFKCQLFFLVQVLMLGSI